MKKYLTMIAAIAAVVMTVNLAMSQSVRPVYVTGSITIPAGATSTTVVPTGLTAVIDPGGIQSVRELEELLFVNTSTAVTGFVFVVKKDLGVSTSIATYNEILPETSTGSQPYESWTKESVSTADWVVTNELLFAVTSTNTVTGYKRPSFRELSITVSNEPAATAAVFNYMIKAY
jgi:hypothetical protein